MVEFFQDTLFIVMVILIGLSAGFFMVMSGIAIGKWSAVHDLKLFPDVVDFDVDVIDITDDRREQIIEMGKGNGALSLMIIGLMLLCVTFAAVAMF